MKTIQLLLHSMLLRWQQKKKTTGEGVEEWLILITLNTTLSCPFQSRLSVWMNVEGEGKGILIRFREGGAAVGGGKREGERGENNNNSTSCLYLYIGIQDCMHRAWLLY